MSNRNLEELFAGELRDLHAGQSELAMALPKLAKAASSPSLRNDFAGQAAKARSHAQRLEEILHSLNRPLPGTEVFGREGTVDVLVYGELVPVESSRSSARSRRCADIDIDPDAQVPGCEALRGLIEEGERLALEIEPSPIKDVGLMAEAQLLEHYTVAAFRTAREHARMLGHTAAEALLEKTLTEKDRGP